MGIYVSLPGAERIDYDLKSLAIFCLSLASYLCLDTIYCPRMMWHSRLTVLYSIILGTIGNFCVTCSFNIYFLLINFPLRRQVVGLILPSIGIVRQRRRRKFHSHGKHGEDKLCELPVSSSRFSLVYRRIHEGGGVSASRDGDVVWSMLCARITRS